MLTLAMGLLPGVNLLSGALLALIELIRGTSRAVLVFALATLFLGGLAWISGHPPVQALVQPLGGPVVSIWVPVLILAAILRTSRSLSLTLAIAALGGCIVVVAQLLILANPLHVWIHLIKSALAMFPFEKAQRGTKGWEQSVHAMARLMPGLSASFAIVASMAMLFIGRYGQSLLIRPGAFGKEFRHLNLGYAITIAGSLLLVGRLVWPGLMFDNLAIVVLAMFMFQGLAVVHWFFFSRSWPRAGLVVMYVLMVFFPLSLPGVVSAVGLIDNWFDFRHLRRQIPEN